MKKNKIADCNENNMVLSRSEPHQKIRIENFL